MVILMEINKNVPDWMLESKTGIEKQNDEVGLIVAKYIGAFRKRGFEEKEIGILLAQAFLLPVEEIEKRVDCILSCGDDENDGKKLCLFVAQKGHLFSMDNSDPCGIIEIIVGKYGKKAAFETILTFPQLLSLWKSENVRKLSEYESQKTEVEHILRECASVFPEKQ